MHAEARQYVAEHAVEARRVLDVGGRFINGSVRDLFPRVTRYTVLDIRPGDDVDIVADAATWVPDVAYDVVLCCEVAEHTEAWPQILATAYKACAPGGRLITTMAGPGRAPHSAEDGGTVRDGEWYENVEPDELERVLKEIGWENVSVDYLPVSCDTRAVAAKPGSG